MGLQRVRRGFHFHFVAFAVRVISNPRSWRFAPIFLPRVLLLCSFTQIFDSFWVNFYTWYEVKVQLHSFACGYSVVLAQFVDSFPQLNCLGIIWKINWSQMCWFISRLSIPFHWSICLSLCQYHTVLITVTFEYVLKLSSVSLPTLFLFLRIGLAYSVSLVITYKF